MIGTTAALIMGGLAAAGAVGGAAISSHASGKAAQTQVDSTKYATDIQKQESDAALALQKQQFDQQQQNLAPWISAGTGALSRLQTLMGPGGDLSTSFDPNSVDITKDPGYQFRVAEGQKAIQSQAAARGGLVSGRALKEADTFNSGLASQEYGAAYDRTFNAFQTGQSTTYNRLAALAGVGQTATGQANQAGQDYSHSAGTILMNTGNALADLSTQAGNARASGYAASGNAWGGALQSGLSNLSNLYFLTQPSSAALFKR